MGERNGEVLFLAVLARLIQNNVSKDVGKEQRSNLILAVLFLFLKVTS